MLQGWSRQRVLCAASKRREVIIAAAICCAIMSDLVGNCMVTRSVKKAINDLPHLISVRMNHNHGAIVPRFHIVCDPWQTLWVYRISVSLGHVKRVSFYLLPKIVFSLTDSKFKRLPGTGTSGIPVSSDSDSNTISNTYSDMCSKPVVSFVSTSSIVNVTRVGAAYIMRIALCIKMHRLGICHLTVQTCIKYNRYVAITCQAIWEWCRGCAV